MNSSDLKMLEEGLEALGGLMGNVISYVVAALLTPIILNYGIRWFIFKKAGEKGWKALIPIYSDYINYKIAWDGRIFKMLVLGHIGSFLLGLICGWIHMGFGAFIGIVLNSAMAGASAICGMILQFKMARCFGRKDYFGVGLYFLSNVFSAMLAFGDSVYQGPVRSDGIGVPSFIGKMNDKMKPAPQPPVAQPAQGNPVGVNPQQYGQPMQMGYPAQPGYAQQPYPVQQQYPQQEYAYPPQQSAEGQVPQRVRRSDRNSGMYGQ